MKNSLISVITQTLGVVAGTSGLNWEIKRKLLNELTWAIRYELVDEYGPEEFAAWVEEEFANVLRREDIRPAYRLMLTQFFVQEVLSWLTGDFDNAAD